jgi:hypothetical protein
MRIAPGGHNRFNFCSTYDWVRFVGSVGIVGRVGGGFGVRCCHMADCMAQGLWRRIVYPRPTCLKQPGDLTAVSAPEPRSNLVEPCGKNRGEDSPSCGWPRAMTWQTVDIGCESAWPLSEQIRETG